MPITPTEAEMIAAAIDSALIDVHVALPGQVQSYNAATQTATVVLQVKRVLPQGIKFVTEDLPVLENVPVQFYRTNSFMLTLPVVAGDFGLVIFNEMSIDQWRSKGANTSPGDIGRHTLTGAVFQPGLMPLAQTLLLDDVSSDMVMGNVNGEQLRVKSSGTVEAVAGGVGGGSADDFVAMAGKVLSELENIASNFDAHTHTVPIVGAAGTTLSTPPLIPITPAPAAVPSSNLKADD